MKKFKQTLLFLVGTLCLSTASMAQEALENIPNSVRSHFERVYNFGQTVKWSTVHDSSNIYIMGQYTKEGDPKTVYYRNDAYWSLETGVVLAYCPKAIRAQLDSLAPGASLTELSYIQSVMGSAYKATITQGKKKKAVCKNLYFTLQGQFIKKLDCKEMCEDFVAQ